MWEQVFWEETKERLSQTDKIHGSRMQGKLCSFSTPMKANFTQPRSSSALTSNPLVACVSLFWGIAEVMLTEEEVLAQIAWDVCRGFLNIKAETTTRILCKMWEHHLQTVVLCSRDAYCKQALTFSTCWPGIPLTIGTVVQRAHRTRDCQFPEHGCASLVCTDPLCTDSGIWELNGTVENLG